MEIKERIVVWARSGGDFNAGIALFLTYNRNVFYARNIQLKGETRGMVTLLSEFSSKSKMPIQELTSLIANSRDHENQPGITYEAKEDLSKPVEIPLFENPASIALKADYAKKSIRLREEFPFLTRNDCPDEMAILVNKMMSAYDAYKLFHLGLFDTDTHDLEKCYESARKVLDAYILNREIWDELNHYKIHGKILGKLPEFKMRQLREHYKAMGTVNLVKIFGNNIPRKMSYYKKQLSDLKTKNMDDIREKMAEAERELAVIRDILKERGEM